MNAQTVGFLFETMTALLMLAGALIYGVAAAKPGLSIEARLFAWGFALIALGISMRHVNLGPLGNTPVAVISLTFVMHSTGIVMALHPKWSALQIPWVTGLLAGIVAIVTGLMLTVGIW